MFKHATDALTGNQHCSYEPKSNVTNNKLMHLNIFGTSVPGSSSISVQRATEWEETALTAFTGCRISLLKRYYCSFMILCYENLQPTALLSKIRVK